MSWDIFVQDLPASAKRIADIPHDFRPTSIGKRSDIIQKIKAVVPFADFTDPSWGRIKGEGFSIEVNLGDDEELLGFAFHVRGSSGMPIGLIADILDHLDLRALDGGNVETGFFDREKAAASLQHWRAYRDHVVNHSHNKS